MSKENLFDQIRTKLRHTEFIARTSSGGLPGISVVFYPPDVMDVRGGNLDLPPGMFLRLTKESVKYHFDPKIFDSSIEFSPNSKKEHETRIIRKEINKALEEKLDDEWQILRLLDPRFLLTTSNFEILKTKERKKMLEIKIQFHLTNFLQTYFSKINLDLREISKKNPDKRIVTIYVDNDNNLKKIKQEELFSNDVVTVSYDTSLNRIKDEIPAII